MLEDFYNDILDNKEYIKYTFSGVLTESEARYCTKEFIKICNSVNKKIIIVWDCLKMEDYEHNARVIWQKVLKDNKKQIEEIWLITDSKIVKAGAELMSLFTSYNINIIESNELLDIKNI